MPKAKRMRIASVLLMTAGLSAGAFAQTTPFVDSRTIQLLRNELSGDIAFDNLRPMTLYHRPRGSKDELKVAEFVATKAKEYGLEEVRLIPQKSSSRSWTVLAAELQTTGAGSETLANYAEVGTSIADYSRSTDITAELIDVGTGMQAQEYVGRDVKGKIVLASGAAMEVMKLAVWDRGAAGIVSYGSTRVSPWVEGGDQVAWQWVPQEDGPKGEKTTFAFIVSPREGLLLHDRLVGAPYNGIFRAPGEGGPGSHPADAENSSAGEKISVHAVIQAQFTSEPEQWLVEGYVRGKERHDQQIVFTAHLQEGKFSANDDGSGCVSMLEIGRTIAKLVREGAIPRPRRDLRFWWTTEGSSEVAYFSEHPDERKNILAALNQDMVGARQSLGSRVQHISRTPYSIPSYLSDVVESIADYVIDSNNSFLSSLEAGTAARGSNFTAPIYSRLGSREAYNARVVPYFDETDHAVFVDGIIGIPAVTLTNWPDEYIHSSADDLWQVDATQIKRNAFVASAAALYLANAGRAEIPQLLTELYSAGRARIAADERTALRIINRSALERQNTERAFVTALNLVNESLLREQREIESVTALGPLDLRGGTLVRNFKLKLAALGKTSAGDLADLYRSLTGQAVPVQHQSLHEGEMTRKIPARIEDVAEYFKKREALEPPEGLHPVMFAETLNFANGRNTYLDIYNAVSAEALSVGEFQYGKVSREAVEAALDIATKNGALRLVGNSSR
jgi:Peptidase family M28